jgi:hypothetical protein
MLSGLHIRPEPGENTAFDAYWWHSTCSDGAGAAAPFVAGKALGASLLGSAANTLQYGVTQYYYSDPLTWRDAGLSLGFGLLAGAIAGPINPKGVLFGTRQALG